MRIQLQLHQSFADYYGQIQFIDQKDGEIITGNDNYYVHHAIFSLYKSQAIFIDSGNKVLFEECHFINNSSQSLGGTIFIKGSDCIFVRICTSHASCTKFGTAYVIESMYQNKSYAIESSVSQCSGVAAAFSHYMGEAKISYMNTSPI